MIAKAAVLVVVALVFVGLGFSGTLNAALNGYHKIEQNPAVEQLQNTTANTIKNDVTNQIHNIKNTVTNALTSKT